MSDKEKPGDLKSFYSYWPATPRAFGKAVGPLTNVKTISAEEYLKGKEDE